MNKAWVEKKIQQLKLQPSRGNGQNFLISEEPLETIIAAGDVHAGDRILEIGPGLGALTEKLLYAGAHVTAIEFDPHLAAYLKTYLKKNIPHEIIHGDILRLITPEFLRAMQPYKIIANIPYHITGEIIRHFTETPNPPIVICLLIQKEVGERLIATPPRTNRLALFTQWFARVEFIATVPAAYFFPQPDVDSCIVRITPGAGAARCHNLTTEEQKQLFSTIKRGFSHPRKQLRNNFSDASDDASDDVLINMTRRAETLTHDEWITLSKTLARTARV